MLRDQLLAFVPLESGGVRVRRFTEADITDDYVSWLNDPAVVRFSNQRFLSHSSASCQAFYSSIEASDSALFVIEYADLGFVGTMTVHFNERHGTADMGILIGDARVRGFGVGASAWITVMNQVLSLPGIRKVTAGTLSCNQPMLSVISKAGMEADGIRKAQELVDGVPYDICYFAAFRADG